MTRVDQAIAALRWVCNDQGTSPQADEWPLPTVLGDGTDASKEAIAKILPYVTEVKNERDIRAFLASVVVRDGLMLNFSPQWGFDTYNDETDRAFYNEHQAWENDELLMQCFSLLAETGRHAEVYSLTESLMFAILLPQP